MNMIRYIGFLSLCLLLETVVGCSHQEKNPIASAKNFYVNRQYQQAFERFLVLARQGNPEAQCFVGYMYSKGEGVTRDYSKALNWFRKSSAQHFPEAQYNLSLMYSLGEGADKDEKAALKWLTLAAYQGLPQAQINLSTCYYSGQMVKKDCSAALGWLKKAADAGNPIAQVRLSIMLAEGKGVEKNQQESLRYLTMAAKQNQAEAQYLLARIYIGNKRFKKGIALLAVSAENGCKASQLAIAVLYVSSGKKYKNKAQSWCDKMTKDGILSTKDIDAIMKFGNTLTQEKCIEKRYEAILDFITEFPSVFRGESAAIREFSCGVKDERCRE